MDHQPPPFFKRGPAPLARLSFYAAISLSLVFVDARFHTLEMLRQGISIVTQPLQKLAQAPLQFADNASAYIFGIERFRSENERLKHAQLETAATLQRTQQLEAENEHLRKLLDIRARQQANGQVSKIIYSARDPFSRRIVVDRGQQDRIAAGQPVIDDAGVVGQVTRVFPYVSEITLITDKDQAVPVQIVRNGLRSVVFGLGNGQLELRFMPANADVQNGDLLVTSGLDGIFLAGLPVAKVVRIERDTSYSFARIYCVPVAGVENFDEVVILDAREALALPPQLSTEGAVSSNKGPAKLGIKKKRLKKD
jgi:rod shape-determining protein MreC